MSTRPRCVLLARTSGSLLAALGIVHCAATPIVLADPALASLPRDHLRGLATMFVATGLGVLYSGVSFLLAARALGRGEAWARRALALVASFVATVSLLCVTTMPANPFAWVALVSSGLAVWTPLCARGCRAVAASTRVGALVSQVPALPSSPQS